MLKISGICGINIYWQINVEVFLVLLPHNLQVCCIFIQFHGFFLLHGGWNFPFLNSHLIKILVPSWKTMLLLYTNCCGLGFTIWFIFYINTVKKGLLTIRVLEVMGSIPSWVIPKTKIESHCYFLKHTKSDNWLAWCQNNMSKWGGMAYLRLFFICVLVQ